LGIFGISKFNYSVDIILDEKFIRDLGGDDFLIEHDFLQSSNTQNFLTYLNLLNLLNL